MKIENSLYLLGKSRCQFNQLQFVLFMVPFVIIYKHMSIYLYIFPLLNFNIDSFALWPIKPQLSHYFHFYFFSFKWYELCPCTIYVYMYVYVCVCIYVCVWIYIFISQSVTISCQWTDMDTLAEFIDNFSWFFSTYSFSLFSLYIFFLIFSPSLHFPHLPRCRCAQQVTGEWSWWWWWWSCWRGDSNCWQARPKCSALRCVSRRYKDTTTTTRTRTITRREAHFRLPSTGVPHSATYAANSSSIRYPLWLWLVTRCCRSRCSAARCSLLRLCRRLSERPAAARPTVLPRRAVATGCKK